MQTAPVSPREPPPITTWPEVNLVDPAARCGASSSTPGAIRPPFASVGAPSGMPIAATRSSPVCSLPGGIQWPSLGAWKVTVASAATAFPSTSPVDALTPEATSVATTGASASFIASLAEAPRAPGVPGEPGPEERAPDHAGAANLRGDLVRFQMPCPVEALQVRSGVIGQLLAGSEQQRLDVEAHLAQRPRGDQTVPAVVAL